AALRRSFTPWLPSPAVTPDGKRIVQALFEACGEAGGTSAEAHIDYCVGMTGTGAALPALLAEALVAHAVQQPALPNVPPRASLRAQASSSPGKRGIRPRSCKSCSTTAALPRPPCRAC